MRFCVIDGVCPFETFEVGEIVLAQCDQDSVVAAREVEALDDRFVIVELGFERARQPVLDQVGQIVDEARDALSARVVALAESEDLFELVEDQQRDERLAGGVEQHVVAVMQELPQRLAFDRGTGLSPAAHGLGGTEDCSLNLLGRRGCTRCMVEAHGHWAVTFKSQPRRDAGVQDRGLAQARLTKQHGERLALHAAREFGDLVVAAVKPGAGFLSERRQAEPGVLRVDGGVEYRIAAC